MYYSVLGQNWHIGEPFSIDDIQVIVHELTENFLHGEMGIRGYISIKTVEPFLESKMLDAFKFDNKIIQREINIAHILSPYGGNCLLGNENI